MDRRRALLLPLALLPGPRVQAQQTRPFGTLVAARPDAAAKRCLAAQRRVERQKQVVRDVEARIARDRQARERCESRRTCVRLDRALKASDARRTRLDKQLAQLVIEADQACALKAIG
jgi:hypothetical protein